MRYARALCARTRSDARIRRTRAGVPLPQGPGRDISLLGLYLTVVGQ